MTISLSLGLVLLTHVLEEGRRQKGLAFWPDRRRDQQTDNWTQTFPDRRWFYSGTSIPGYQLGNGGAF